MNLSVVILAAGQGTRMRSDLPKVLHPLAGRPMLRYVLDAARNLEPARLAVVVGNGAELVSRALNEQTICVAQTEQQGTAHAVHQAESVVAGRAPTVLVLYGDTPLIRPETLSQMVDHHLATAAVVTVATFRPDDPTGYGRIVRDVATGEIRCIIEEKQATAGELNIREVSGGIFCFSDAWLWPGLAQVEPQPGGELYLTDLAAIASGQGRRVESVSPSDPLELIGVDDRLELAQAEAEIRRRINARWMLAGVTLIDPVATYIDADAEIGADTVVWPGTFLQGRTRIGRECIVGPGAVVRDSTVADRCRVELSVLEGAVMEDGSNVGPYSHLRKGARLGTGAHVGNFGEIKNSVLGSGVKMGHVSYLGDATVGANANIGAGTITCNFDGKQKHPTVIGEGAFVGSDAMLVAPVSVGEGAKIGAGSVVTHDIPSHAVAYGVPARVRTEYPSEEAE